MVQVKIHKNSKYLSCYCYSLESKANEDSAVDGGWQISPFSLIEGEEINIIVTEMGRESIGATLGILRKSIDKIWFVIKAPVTPKLKEY